MLQTDRLILRPLNLEDAPDLLSLNADEEVTKYSGDGHFENLEAAEKFIQQYKQYEKYGLGRWSVFERNSKAFIGWSGLKLNQNGEIDLGFRFLRSFWGLGYATEVGHRWLDFAFKERKINEVIARTSIQNTAAQKVLQKIGMKKQYNFEYEGIGECYFYRLTKNEYLDHEKMS